MPDTKISALPDGTALADTDEVVLRRASGNVKLTGAQIKAAVSGAGIFGPYDDTTDLQAAKPAASNPGAFAYVGGSAPYSQYVSNGTAWVVSGTNSVSTAITRTSKGLIVQKMGRAFDLGTSGAYDEGIAESPCVWWDANLRCYAMAYVGYNAGITAASVGLATALTPRGPWKKRGSAIFSASGSGVDASGTSGPVMYYEAGTYYLFYIGLTSNGYEGGTKRLCVATTTSLAGTPTWTRLGAIISPGGTGFRKTAIWHTSMPIKRSGTYYIFFNATGDTAGGTGVETIGYATAASPAGPWVVQDANCPLLDVASATWESLVVGDPSVWWNGEEWQMAYFGTNGTISSDGMAFTSDANFPLGWTKYSGNPTLSPAPSRSRVDSAAAHKPFIFHDPYEGNRHYHYYTAVSSANVRSICIAWDGPTRREDSIILSESVSTRTTATGNSTAVLLSGFLVCLNRPGTEIRLLARVNPGGAGTLNIGISGAGNTGLSATGNSWQNLDSGWSEVPATANELDALLLNWSVTSGTASFGSAVVKLRYRDEQPNT